MWVRAPFVEILQDSSLEGPALFEVDSFPCPHRDLLSGFGIAGFTLCPRADPEKPEVPELERIARPQPLLHGLKEEIHQFLFFPPNPGKLAGQPDYQFGFCHRDALL